MQRRRASSLGYRIVPEEFGHLGEVRLEQPIIVARGAAVRAAFIAEASFADTSTESALG